MRPPLQKDKDFLEIKALCCCCRSSPTIKYYLWNLPHGFKSTIEKAPFCIHYPPILPCFSFGVATRIVAMVCLTSFNLHIIVIFLDMLLSLVHYLFPFSSYQSLFLSYILASIIHCYYSISTPLHHHHHLKVVHVPNWTWNLIENETRTLTCLNIRVLTIWLTIISFFQGFMHCFLFLCAL